MPRKSSSTQSRQRSGKSSGSGAQGRLSASNQRGSAQSRSGNLRSERAESASTGRGRNRPDDHQEWRSSPPQSDYGESRRGDERSFASRERDYDRGRPVYSPQGERDRGFTSPDSERRREFAERGGRPGGGRFENPEQNERRFAREMDSYYGRAPRSQESRERSFRGDDDFRSSGRDERGDWPQTSREEEYRSAQSRYQRARSSQDDYDRRPFPREDYSSGARQQEDRDDFRREEGYEDRGDYQGSARESGRYSQDEDNRFYAGRGERSTEREPSGQRRQSGSRGGRTTGSRRRD